MALHCWHSMASLHERAGEAFLAVRKPCCVGMWLAFAMALPLDLRAQTTTATARGKAADEHGAALPGVTVTARQVDTNTSLSVTSSDVGISDYWRAPGLETVLPSGTEDHPYLVKGDLNVNNKNRLSVRYDRSVRKDLNLSQSGSAIDTKEDRYAFGGPIRTRLSGTWGRPSRKPVSGTATTTCRIPGS